MSTRHLSPTDIGNVGKPPSEQSGKTLFEKSIYDQIKNEKVKNAKIQFMTWIIGFIISVIPLLILPILKILDNVKTHVAFSDFFSNPELFFIGISITIATVNDFINNANKFIDIVWFKINILLIIYGILIYTVIVVHKYYRPEAHNEKVFTAFTLIYLSVTFILGCVRYIKNILEQKGVI